MIKNHHRKLIIASEKDQKHLKNFQHFMDIFCDMSSIEELSLCHHAYQAIQDWENHYGHKVWELFRFKGVKRDEGKNYFKKMFLNQIDSDLYSDQDFDDIVFAIDKGLDALFSNRLRKVFPQVY